MHDSSSNLSPLGASTELVQLSSDMNILESLYWNSFGFDLIKIHLLRVEQFISKKGQNFVCKYTHIFPKRVLHRVENGWGCGCSFVKWSHMVKNDMLKLHLYTDILICELKKLALDITFKLYFSVAFLGMKEAKNPFWFTINSNMTYWGGP